MFVTETTQNSDNLISFKKYAIRIARVLYICILSVNIKNIDIKYSHCEPINFK